MKLALSPIKCREMIRVVLTDGAYDAIASTLPRGAARWPMQRDAAAGLAPIHQNTFGSAAPVVATREQFIPIRSHLGQLVAHVGKQLAKARCDRFERCSGPVYTIATRFPAANPQADVQPATAICATLLTPITSPEGSRPSEASPPTRSSAKPGPHSRNDSQSVRSRKCRD
jgi:hypothetical protein